MSWEIVTQTETADFARVSVTQLQDIWYDMAVGMVEQYTGWSSLSTPENAQEYVNGSGSSLLRIKSPVNTVSVLEIHGVSVPASLYYVNWYGIEMRSYVPDSILYITYSMERSFALDNVFPFGIKNVYVEYNYGGISSLPDKYKNALKWALLQIIKEMSTVPRTEGSDSMLRKYRPDRTLLPEEVLRMYGIHGKILGILGATLPKQKVWE